MNKAVQTIWREHANMASVLACLRYLLGEIEKDAWAPDFQLLRDIIDYIEEFPEKMHHPKEEDYILVALARRRPESGTMLDKVREEHVKGAEMLADLRARLEAYESDPAAFDGFCAAARAYIDFERRHMAREERELLPLARRELSAEDWHEIETAFARNEDPLFGPRARRSSTNCSSTSSPLPPCPWASPRARRAGRDVSSVR